MHFVHADGTRFFKNGCKNFKTTLAIELPSKTDLETMFKSHSTSILMKMGYAVQHEKDNFVKSKGREIALGRLNYIKADITHVSIIGTRHVYHFNIILTKINGEKLDANIAVSTVAEADNVHLLSGYCGFDRYG